MLSERREIYRQCRETEARIKDDWQYLRDNAGKLMWGEISALLRPRRRTLAEGAAASANPWLLMAWQLGKPILYRWMGEMGWQVFKNMFTRRK